MKQQKQKTKKKTKSKNKRQNRYMVLLSKIGIPMNQG
jgi:hypothetical protein